MSDRPGESLESPEEVHAALVELHAIKDWLDTAETLLDPLPGSALAQEDRLNPYKPGSHLAGFYDAIARDTLAAVIHTRISSGSDGTRGVPAFALYSQLRASTIASVALDLLMAMRARYAELATEDHSRRPLLYEYG